MKLRKLTNKEKININAGNIFNDIEKDFDDFFHDKADGEEQAAVWSISGAVGVILGGLANGFRKENNIQKLKKEINNTDKKITPFQLELQNEVIKRNAKIKLKQHVTEDIMKYMKAKGKLFALMRLEETDLFSEEDLQLIAKQERKGRDEGTKDIETAYDVFGHVYPELEGSVDGDNMLTMSMVTLRRAYNVLGFNEVLQSERVLDRFAENPGNVIIGTGIGTLMIRSYQLKILDKANETLNEWLDTEDNRSKLKKVLEMIEGERDSEQGAIHEWIAEIPNDGKGGITKPLIPNIQLLKEVRRNTPFVDIWEKRKEINLRIPELNQTMGAFLNHKEHRYIRRGYELDEYGFVPKEGESWRSWGEEFTTKIAELDRSIIPNISRGKDATYERIGFMKDIRAGGNPDCRRIIHEIVGGICDQKSLGYKAVSSESTRSGSSDSIGSVGSAGSELPKMYDLMFL